MRGHWHDV